MAYVVLWSLECVETRLEYRIYNGGPNGPCILNRVTNVSVADLPIAKLTP